MSLQHDEITIFVVEIISSFFECAFRILNILDQPWIVEREYRNPQLRCPSSAHVALDREKEEPHSMRRPTEYRISIPTPLEPLTFLPSNI